MSNYVIEAIKNVIDVELLLRELGATIKRKSRDEITIKCLNPDHEDRHASCNYNIKKHTWNCLGCEWKGSLFSLVMLTKGIDYRSALKWLKKYTGVSERVHDDDMLMKSLEYKKTMKLIKAMNVDKETDLPNQYENDFKLANPEIVKYIKKRKINKLILKKYFIGFCNAGYYKDRIIIPVIHFDKIVGFVARSTWEMENDYDDRYLFENDAVVGSMIWGLFNNHNKSKPVFVEGSFDALRLRSYGLNSYSCLSNNVSETQSKLIKKHFDSEIYIMPDADAGGVVMKKRFHEELSHYKKIYVCSIDSPDPDTASKLEVLRSQEKSRLLTDLISSVTEPIYQDSITRRL